jgi:hypothetical protein
LFSKGLDGNSTSKELCAGNFALFVDAQAESSSNPISETITHF